MPRPGRAPGVGRSSRLRPVLNTATGTKHAHEVPCTEYAKSGRLAAAESNTIDEGAHQRSTQYGQLGIAHLGTAIATPGADLFYSPIRSALVLVQAVHRSIHLPRRSTSELRPDPLREARPPSCFLLGHTPA
eukprot:scaffold46615_cov31-Tisochrysis_lutea.AAC.3